MKNSGHQKLQDQIEALQKEIEKRMVLTHRN